MLFSQNRDQMRQFFTDAWRKRQTGQVMEPLETMIADVIELHPEYQPLLADPDRAVAADYRPEHGQTNPFLHLGMHIALREQLGTDRPAGVRAVYQTLCRHDDPHAAEHRMLDVLGETLWEASRSGTAPDEARYLQRLRRLIPSGTTLRGQRTP